MNFLFLEAVRRVDEGLRLRAISPDGVQGPADHFRAARLLARLGQTGRALALLEGLPAAGEHTPQFIALHPDFDALRNEPRFEAVAGGAG